MVADRLLPGREQVPPRIPGFFSASSCRRWTFAWWSGIRSS